MRTPTFAAGLASQALILLLAGCSGGGGGAPTPAPSPTPTPTPTPTPPPPSGLDSRPSNTTCLAGDAPNNEVPYGVQEVYPNLPNFTQPIAMLQAPGDAARWYVVQKTGSVRVFDNTANVSTSSEFINIASRLNSDPGSSERRARPARHGVPSRLPG